MVALEPYLIFRNLVNFMRYGGEWIIHTKKRSPKTIADSLAKLQAYSDASKLLARASGLVGNPGTGISSSTDIAADNWQKDYDKYCDHKNDAQP